MLCKQLTSNYVDEEQVPWFGENEKEPKLVHWCEVTKHGAYIQNIFMW